ncbi:hypothetical protein MJL81_32895, partial [Salmonella enterica subsp. enterica serovar Anatum]|nr:hypothetical protein [Salmonella enterica subsp. enterica serovar Anatum]
CSLPLINLFEVAPSAVGLSTQGWPGQIRILTCQCCTAYNTVFPKKLTLVGVIPQSLEPHIGLTPTVEAMIEPALEQVLAALRE